MSEQRLSEQKLFEERILEERLPEEKLFDEKSFEQQALRPKPFTSKTFAPRPGSLPVNSPVPTPLPAPDDPKQHRLMLAALALLLVALGFVFYRDRDFWFPAQESEVDQPADSAPGAAYSDGSAPANSASANTHAQAGSDQHSAPIASFDLTAPARKSSSKNKNHAKAAASATIARSVEVNPAPEADPPPVVISNRTVLPPLEVEVVAGNTHKTLRPNSNTIRLDTEPDAQPEPAPEPAVNATPNANVADETAATTAEVTNNASERVEMSPGTAAVVSHPVNPGYPLLARQMKVQGQVILRALISKDGSIQDLHVLSGPHILASAAQDAVRQWHFKPHLINDEPVETQAKITVNFTISTN